MSELLIPLTTEMDQEKIQQIELFKERFEELWANWESLKKLGIEIGGTFHNLGKNKVSGSDCGIEIHRLKGFYLDFRFFWAEKEDTNLKKITGMLGKHCENNEARDLLKRNNNEWKNSGVLEEWHGVKSNDMIRILFNGNLFHSDREERTRFFEIQRLMKDELAHQFLIYNLYNKMLVIRNINWIVGPLSIDSQMIRIPKE